MWCTAYSYPISPLEEQNVAFFPALPHDSADFFLACIDILQKRTPKVVMINGPLDGLHRDFGADDTDGDHKHFSFLLRLSVIIEIRVLNSENKSRLTYIGKNPLTFQIDFGSMSAIKDMFFICPYYSANLVRGEDTRHDK